MSLDIEGVAGGMYIDEEYFQYSMNSPSLQLQPRMPNAPAAEVELTGHI